MFIGIDLGTSSIKTVLIDENQKIIDTASKLIPLQNLKSGYYEQDPETWFNATLSCLNNLRNNNNKEYAVVKSIGISGQMHGATLLDKNNEILRPCILWNDTRSVKECIEIENKYPNFKKKSGNIAMPGFTAPKLLWIKKNEKDIFNKINKVLLPKDYLRFKFTGSFFSDMSDSSGTLWLDVKKRKWSDELLKITNLSIDNMPKLVEGSEPSDSMLKSISNNLGFKNEVVFAGGAGDQAAGAIGAGVIKTEQSMISLGTSGVFFSPTNQYTSNTKQAVHSFCHCIPNTWHHMSVMLSATNCLNWFCKLHNNPINDSLKKAEIYFNKDFKIDNTPYFLPYLSGERTPHNKANLRGAFHLLSTSTTYESLVYSIIEGICFGIRDGVEAVNLINNKSSSIYLIGGGSKSSFWAKILSSIVKENIIIGKDSDLGPALGAARLAMLSTNQFSIDEIIKNVPVVNEYSYSQILSEKFDERYQKWKNIVNVNLPLSNKIL